MSIKQHLTHEQARQFGDNFGFDWERSCASVEQLAGSRILIWSVACIFQEDTRERR